MTLSSEGPRLTFGVRGHDVTGARSPEELGSALEGFGVHAVQLAPAKSFPAVGSGAAEINPGFGSHVRRALGAHGVDVAVLGCYFNMIHPDLAEREAGIEKFEAYLSCARSFGCGIVASETGSVDVSFSYTEDNFTLAAFEDAARVIRRLCRVAERYGVTVGIEPGVNHPIHDAETFGWLVEYVDSPALGLVLDPTALVTPELAPRQLDIAREMVERFRRRICACHLVDYRIENGALVRCPAGEGVLPIEELAALFADARPWGFVISEFTEDEGIARLAARLAG